MEGFCYISSVLISSSVTFSPGLAFRQTKWPTLYKSSEKKKKKRSDSSGWLHNMQSCRFFPWGLQGGSSCPWSPIIHTERYFFDKRLKTISPLLKINDYHRSETIIEWLTPTLYSLPNFVMPQTELINYPTISNIEMQGGGRRMRERGQEGGHVKCS